MRLTPRPSHAERLSDTFAAADEREQARDRLLEYYLIAAEAADERLRELPPILAPEEFTDRNGALAWLDAERPCLVAVVRMAADTGREGGEEPASADGLLPGLPWAVR